MIKNKVTQQELPKEILIGEATKKNLSALQQQMDTVKQQMVALSNMAIGMVLKNKGIDKLEDNVYQINNDCTKFILIENK